ncbi:hypothetical protein PLESTB_001807900 [Pleodorina starrii]|uniref:Uncharacterized protein n=1 Tax=Pleodorina starrii TaxID=330485 RepID=A0A9W6FA14_9CHLO|nr:hypothetical protein PLESTM_000904000 [Pleodorina starrii]GLC61828.1 hypothetical protein PLESTB_001807900 [Pleodorina starrii]GLC70479.1 hypothetical protein PLESTF_000986100 [Pleodorina starrii]
MSILPRRTWRRFCKQNWAATSAAPQRTRDFRGRPESVGGRAARGASQAAEAHRQAGSSSGSGSSKP